MKMMNKKNPLNMLKLSMTLKKNLNRFIDLAMLIIMLVNDVMNTFNSPQNAKNKKKLQAKNL